MPFTAITSIKRRIDYLRDCMAGIVPPWYRKSCVARIAILKKKAAQLCIEA